MAYNTLNYTEQGGAKTVIGGTLEIASGATITGLGATATVAGLVKKAANVPQSAEAASPTTAQFNALLTALKAAGIVTADT